MKTKTTIQSKKQNNPRYNVSKSTPKQRLHLRRVSPTFVCAKNATSKSMKQKLTKTEK